MRGRVEGRDRQTDRHRQRSICRTLIYDSTASHLKCFCLQSPFLSRCWPHVTDVFSSHRRAVLSVFFTEGFPSLWCSFSVVKNCNSHFSAASNNPHRPFPSTVILSATSQNLRLMEHQWSVAVFHPFWNPANLSHVFLFIPSHAHPSENSTAKTEILFHS